MISNIGELIQLYRLAQREQERDVEQVKLDRLLKQMKRQTLQVTEDVLMALVTDMRRALEIGEMRARQESVQMAVEKIIVGPTEPDYIISSH